MRKHKDVEFHVESADGNGARVFPTFDAAAGHALALAASGKPDVCVDVVIWSEAGARAYGGDDAAETYREDPDASVFERIEVKANSLGRIA